MKKIETRNPILGDVIVPALDELGYGDTEPEIISMSKSDGYGADIVLRLHTDTPRVSWTCYVQTDCLPKVLMYCILTEQHGADFKILDKASYIINTKDLRFASVKEVLANKVYITAGK
jgi:hypothetical protein